MSNRGLAILLILAVAISVGSLYYATYRLQTPTVKGAATSDTATATLNISTLQAISFAVSTIDWGTGWVNTTGGATTCTLYTTTDPQTGCAGFNDATNNASLVHPLVLENVGTTVVNVTLRASANASTLIGGTNPSIQWMVTANETGSCSSYPVNTWTEVSTTDTDVCYNLNYTDNKDSFKVDLKITIPYDSSTGQKTLTLTASIKP